ncbi:hypothetical protein AAKU67_003154 [Oxalobacteraceae bacterium GrIS 2.11]
MDLRNGAGPVINPTQALTVSGGVTKISTVTGTCKIRFQWIK